MGPSRSTYNGAIMGPFRGIPWGNNRAIWGHAMRQQWGHLEAYHGAAMGPFGGMPWSSDGAIWGHTIG